MAEQATAEADALAGEARRWRDTYQAAEDALVAAARRGAADGLSGAPAADGLSGAPAADGLSGAPAAVSREPIERRMR
jgi:hypothetical protein